MNLETTFNPLFSREKTFALNGEWDFSFNGQSWQKINVPYCPQSKLSGIGHTEAIPVCFYRKKFNLEKIQERVILHFGAVDYRSIVSVNGKYACSHIGGFTPFESDITDYCLEGENEITLTVYDENKDIPFGKQSWKEKSFGCFYTRTTGIWQPVWLEFVPENRIQEFYFYPCIQEGSVDVDLQTTGIGKYHIEIFYEGCNVGECFGEMRHRIKIHIPLKKRVLWDFGVGALYDVKITFEKDKVYSYFGLREVGYDGYRFLLNGKETFQKLVLDQGYYPDGLYTAPSIEAMQKDITLGLDLGFNGVRLHQKVFDPRFLYLCDKAGYMVWGEYPSWGVDYSNLNFLGQFLSEWQEAVKRDFNHPSIITWCPLNEAWGDWLDPTKKRDVRFIETVYEVTKTLDPTRPCVDVSGGHHGRKTDVYDFHSYESIDKLKKYLIDLQEKDLLEIPLLYCEGEDDLHYKGDIPLNISEFGGISFGNCVQQEEVNEGAVLSEDSWGYGKGEADGDGLVCRYKELVELIFSIEKLSGMCYTQLYDVEQEENGFYNYDRSDKLTQKQKLAIKQINDKR